MGVGASTGDHYLVGVFSIGLSHQCFNNGAFVVFAQLWHAPATYKIVFIFVG